MGTTVSPVSGIVRVHKTMCRDYIPSWSRIVCWYDLLGIPIEVIPIVHSTLLIIDCRMLRSKAKIHLWVHLDIPKHVEYMFDMFPTS